MWAFLFSCQSTVSWDDYQCVSEAGYRSETIRERRSRDPHKYIREPMPEAVSRYQKWAESTTLFGLVPQQNNNYQLTDHPALQKHFRGIDRCRAVANKEDANSFVARARYEFDMPLACSKSKSIKHGIDFCKKVLGLSADEYQYFFLAHMTYLLIAGHHTLHECAYVAKLAGLLYEEGNYASILPRAFIEENKITLQVLQEQFPGLLKIDFEVLQVDPEVKSQVFSFQTK